MRRRNYVWVIEMWCVDRWEPCSDAGQTKEEGERKIRQEWRVNNPFDRFRVAKYEEVTR